MACADPAPEATGGAGSNPDAWQQNGPGPYVCTVLNVWPLDLLRLVASTAERIVVRGGHSDRNEYSPTDGHVAGQV